MKIKKAIIFTFLILAIVAGFIIEDYFNRSYNVILISLDTLRADHMGSYGYKRNTTPYLDKFAEDCAVFENVYAQSPNTVISHATMLTALQPRVHEATPEIILSDDFETLQDYFKRRDYKTGGFTSHGAWLNRNMGFAQGFDQFHSDFINAEKINGFVFDFLEKNKSDNFFLFVHYYDIHSDYDKLPYETKTDYDNTFGNDYQGSFTGCREGFCASTFLEKVNTDNWTIPEEELRYITALYDNGILYTDNQVNRLFDRLKELELFEDSLIIITSDHGEEFMEHGRTLHLQMYREVMQVPLIIKLPGKNKPVRIKNAVGVIDIMPTALDITEIEHSDLQGRSLLPLIKGEDEKNRFVFSTLFGLEPEGEYGLFLRHGSNSFFTHNRFTNTELYDTMSDPQEKQNIAEKDKRTKMELLKKTREFFKMQQKIQKHFKFKKTQSVLSKEDREKLKSLGYLN
ncbi:MAG: sulfatase [bacterium]|nr:sulfatase [bacterium]